MVHTVSQHCTEAHQCLFISWEREAIENRPTILLAKGNKPALRT